MLTIVVDACIAVDIVADTASYRYALLLQNLLELLLLGRIRINCLECSGHFGRDRRRGRRKGHRHATGIDIAAVTTGIAAVDMAQGMKVVEAITAAVDMKVVEAITAAVDIAQGINDIAQGMKVVEAITTAVRLFLGFHFSSCFFDVIIHPVH
jgi:hypothetical protein